MPPVLRNGGIATHWLLPFSLTFREPDEDSGKEVTLFANDVKTLVVALHSKEPPRFEHEDDANTVLKWARFDGTDPKYDNNHDANWQEMLEQLAHPELRRGCEGPKGGASYSAP